MEKPASYAYSGQSDGPNCWESAPNDKTWQQVRVNAGELALFACSERALLSIRIACVPETLKTRRFELWPSVRGRWVAQIEFFHGLQICIQLVDKRNAGWDFHFRDFFVRQSVEVLYQGPE